MLALVWKSDISQFLHVLRTTHKQVRESPDGENSSVVTNLTATVTAADGETLQGTTDIIIYSSDEPRDVLMEFVMQEERAKRAEELFKRRPAVVRHQPRIKKRRATVKKQRSRSLSDRSRKAMEDKAAAASERRSVSRHSLHAHSAERIPNLSPFEEERICWRKSLEDDIFNEEERKSRMAMKRNASPATTPMMPQEPDSPQPTPQPWSSSSSSAASGSDIGLEATVLFHDRESVSKVARKHWDKDNKFKPKEEEVTQRRPAAAAGTRNKGRLLNRKRAGERTVTKSNNVGEMRTTKSQAATVPDPPLSAECFIVSRAWQIDQNRLLRALDRIMGANFARVQLATTMNCVVEYVRPHLDVVVVHIGSQELIDATHSVDNNKDNAVSVAWSVATVISRQIIKLSIQNRQGIDFDGFLSFFKRKLSTAGPPTS